MVKDLTRGNPIVLILRFAMPLLAGTFFQQLYVSVDAFILGRYLGVEALAAVGCTACLVFLITGFLTGLSAGFAIVLAQYFGAKDYDALRGGFCASILLGAVFSAVFTLASVPNTDLMLRLMNTPEELIPDASVYLAPLLASLGGTVFFNIFSRTITAMGDSRTPLVFLCISCALNIVLDLFFILVLDLGILGASLATAIAQILSALLCLACILRTIPCIRPRKSDWSGITRALLAKHLRMGLPMGFQSSLISSGIMLVQAALNTLGTSHVAAFTAAYRVDAFAIMPLMSFGLAMSTYTGQCFGAGRILRIRKAVRQASLVALGYAGFTALLFFTEGEVFVRFFVGDGQEEIVELGNYFLEIQSAMYWVLALLFVLRSTLQGLGKSLVPTIAGVGELVMRVIAAIWLVGPFGYTGVCVASPLAWVGSCLPLAIAYALWVRSCPDRRHHA